MYDALSVFIALGIVYKDKMGFIVYRESPAERKSRKEVIFSMRKYIEIYKENH